MHDYTYTDARLYINTCTHTLPARLHCISWPSPPTHTHTHTHTYIYMQTHTNIHTKLCLLGCTASAGQVLQQCVGDHPTGLAQWPGSPEDVSHARSDCNAGCSCQSARKAGHRGSGAPGLARAGVCVLYVVCHLGCRCVCSVCCVI